MLAGLGPDYAGQLGSQDGATAAYRGQIGRRSAWAHAVAHDIRFEPGDMLVSETAAPVWGYNAELERGMVVGEATYEQRRLFDHVVAAQQVAFVAFRPAVTCADGARRLPSLGHGRRHRGRGRDPHRLSARPREPDVPGLVSARSYGILMFLR
jgi:Metallopeptidase family M24